jgi:hypothetical protein
VSEARRPSAGAASEGVADEDEWPTTMRFSRRLGEFHRGAAYARPIDGPYSRFKSFGWTMASAGLIVMLLGSIAAQAAYLLPLGGSKAVAVPEEPARRFRQAMSEQVSQGLP